MLSLIACGGSIVQIEKSSFDGKENLIMRDIVITSDVTDVSYNRPKTYFSMNWNDSMPKNRSLAKITIFGKYRHSDNTAVNINVAGEKFQFKTTDINKTAEVVTKSRISTTLGKQGTNEDYIETENMLELYFYIPDNVVIKIAKSKNDSPLPLMINLANNVRVESSIRWLYKGDFAKFINTKVSLK